MCQNNIMLIHFRTKLEKPEWAFPDEVRKTRQKNLIDIIINIIKNNYSNIPDKNMEI